VASSPRTAPPVRRRMRPGDDEDDEELAAYNAYLARLTAEARGHGKWHGLG